MGREPLAVETGRSRPRPSAAGGRRTSRSTAAADEPSAVPRSASAPVTGDASPSDSAPARRGPTGAGPSGSRTRARQVADWSAAVLLAGAVAWFVAQALLAVALLAGALVTALLLTALLQPAAGLLRRAGASPALASGLTTLALLAFFAALALLVYSRSVAQLSQLPPVLTQAVDEMRRWLVTGPLELDPAQVGEVRNAIVSRLQQAAPTAMAGAMTALRLVGAAIVVVFAVFFLLKDGAGMWRWLLRWTPRPARSRVETAGEAAWETLSGYVRGTVVVAAVDAVGIGTVLVVLGVPLWLALTVLTFLGAFVPLIGATVAGVAAVLVTAATEGGRDAVIVAVAVLVVQQLEGNLLQPLIMSRAVQLHPLAILCAVTAGGLVLGIVGALVAVPLLAVSYRAAAALRNTSYEQEPREEPAVHP